MDLSSEGTQPPLGRPVERTAKVHLRAASEDTKPLLDELVKRRASGAPPGSFKRSRRDVPRAQPRAHRGKVSYPLFSTSSQFVAMTLLNGTLRCRDTALAQHSFTNMTVFWSMPIKMPTSRHFTTVPFAASRFSAQTQGRCSAPSATSFTDRNH